MLEIERKFLIENLPPDYQKFPVKTIRQGYLSYADDYCTTRIRQRDESYMFCVKQPKSEDSLVRHEVEWPIDKERFDRLWQLTEGRRIEKKRYILPWHNKKIELDIFEGSLKDLCLAEIEYDSVEEIENIPIPEWFSKELTLDYRFTNSHLAQYGLPKDSLEF